MARDDLRPCRRCRPLYSGLIVFFLAFVALQSLGRIPEMQHLAGMRLGTRPCASQSSALPCKTTDGIHRIAVTIPHAVGRRASSEVSADDRTASHYRAGPRRTAPEDSARRRNTDIPPVEQSLSPRQQRGSRSAPQDSAQPTSSLGGLPPSHRSLPLDLDWKAAPRPPREVDFRRKIHSLRGSGGHRAAASVQDPST